MNWLETCVVSAISQKLCLEMNCTTCGAFEFRNEFKILATKNRVYEDLDYTIVHALAGIGGNHCDYEFRRAIRLVIFDIWLRRGDMVCEEILWPRLGTGFSFKVLKEMQAHWTAINQLKEQKLNDIKEYKRERLQQKQERGKQRIEKKREIDREWQMKRIRSE